MELTELHDEHKQEYQDFVHANGPFLQDWLWGDFRKSSGREIMRYAIFDPGIVLSVQFSKVEYFGKSYLFAEYGPVASEELRKDAAALKKYLQFLFENIMPKFPNAIFFRIEPAFVQGEHNLEMPHLVKSADVNPHQSLILDLALPVKTLLEQMHPKTRYNIKIGQRDGVEVRVSENLSEQAALPFAQTAERSHVRLFKGGYYEDLLKFFSDSSASIHAKVYTAWHQGDLLATNLMLYYNKTTAVYLFGGSSDIKRTIKAPHVLQWQAMKDAKEAGFAEYDLWGFELDPNHKWYGFSRFKAGFGGEVRKYYGTYDYMFKSTWYNIYRGLRKLNRIKK